MSSKAKKFFWIAAIVILLLILGGKLLQGLWRQRSTPVFLPNPQAFEAAVGQIHLQKGSTKLALAKKDNVWRLGGMPEDSAADEAKVKELIESLKEASLEESVSSRRERYQEFSLEGDEAIALEAKDFSGRTLISGFLGKQLLGQWDRLYWRFADKNDVFILKGLNRYGFERSAEDFKAKPAAQAATPTPTQK